MTYWLAKSESNIFGVDRLASRPTQTKIWDGND